MNKVFILFKTDDRGNRNIEGLYLKKDKGLSDIKKLLVDKEMNIGDNVMAWEYELGWLEFQEYEVIE